MNHIERRMKEIGLTKKRIRKAEPFDRFMKKQLWAQLEEMKKRLECVAVRANVLGRDLGRIDRAAGQRAYDLRDLAKGDYRGRGEPDPDF